MRKKAKRALGTNRRDADPHKGKDTKSWNIVRGDLVELLAGPEKGKQGKVIRVNRGDEKVYVQGANIRKMKLGPTMRMLETRMVTKEAGIPVGAVGLVDPVTMKRTKFEVKTLPDGTRVRVAKDTQNVIPKPPLVRRINLRISKIKWRDDLNTPTNFASEVTRKGGILPVAALYPRKNVGHF